MGSQVTVGFVIFPESQVAFRRENVFSFRKHSFAEFGMNMIVSFRKLPQNMENTAARNR
jgi:hypothetical protein